MKVTYLKIYNILTTAERRGGLLLFALMLLGMLLETIGIGLVVPAITLMMQDDLVVRYPELKSTLDLMGNPSQTELITVSMLGLVAIYLFKNVFLAYLIWRQTHYSYDVHANLSKRLFENYLHQPYTFHLQRNSAELIRNVTGEVGLFTGVITSSLMLITEFMVLVGVVILLLFVEPVGALVVASVLGTVAWLFHRITSKRISNWGIERQYHDGLSIQHLQQGLSGAKDVKLLGRESEFLLQFHAHNKKSARAWKLSSTLQNLPRLIFELLAVTGLAILVVSMMSQGRSMSSIIPTLGLFAVAAFRLMPSVNRILTSLQALRYSLPVVNTLYDEVMMTSVESFSNKSCSTNVYKNELRLTNLKYYYPDTTTPSLNDISICIPVGKSIGVIGESGSGKSTLVDVILGLLTPTSGVVEVDGKDIQKGLRQWQNQIGYVPQSIYLTDDTLKRNVAFGIANEEIDELAVHRAIKAAQLDVFVEGLPDGLETIVGERGVRLSGGQRQRIGIARALYHDPIVLVLDEATSALDSVTEQEVMEAVSLLQGSKTIIIVAHRLSTVENCDCLYRLADGKIIEKGRPEDIFFPKNTEFSEQ